MCVCVGVCASIPEATSLMRSSTASEDRGLRVSPADKPVSNNFTFDMEHTKAFFFLILIFWKKSFLFAS